MELLCDDPPELLGAARFSIIHFTTAEEANVATHTWAELTGGDLTLAPILRLLQQGKQNQEDSFYIGDSVTQKDTIRPGWMLRHPLLKAQPLPV